MLILLLWHLPYKRESGSELRLEQFYWLNVLYSMYLKCFLQKAHLTKYELHTTFLLITHTVINSNSQICMKLIVVHTPKSTQN